jgi:hypothetical protein
MIDDVTYPAIHICSDGSDSAQQSALSNLIPRRRPTSDMKLCS